MKIPHRTSNIENFYPLLDVERSMFDVRYYNVIRAAMFGIHTNLLWKPGELDHSVNNND